MQNAASAMITLDILINFYWADSGMYPDLISKYQRSGKDMLNDSFPSYICAVEVS